MLVMMPAVQAESSAKRFLVLAVCFVTGSLDARVDPIGANMSSFLPSLPDLVDPVGLVVFVVHWTLDDIAERSIIHCGRHSGYDIYDWYITETSFL